MILRQNYDADITVDGGISDDTARSCVSAGANILVAGTALFRQPDLTGAVANLRTAANSATVSG